MAHPVQDQSPTVARDAGHGRPRNLVVCIDGTGNHPDDATEEGNDTTNVLRLSEALARDEEQVTDYFRGVGTSGWVLIDAKGQLAGYGAERLRDKALAFLESNYQPGDRIYLFGFSRGAAICRDLANAIHDRGLRSTPSPLIAFLGLWDTVAAFGIPIDVLGLPTGSIELGKCLDVPASVRQTVHLLAIDERRTPFIPTLVEAGPAVEEIWFAGAHADVGGGFRDRELAEVPLRYMIRRAAEHGLRFSEDAVRAIPANDDARGELHDKPSLLPKELRRIVVRKDGRESNLPPAVHESVVRRLQSGGYRPPNLFALEGKYRVVS
jgi:uncharacterized protein (DUF2235 family)